MPIAQTAQQAYALFLHTWDQGKICFIEQFKVMLLNHASKVLGICNLFTGGITSTSVDVRILLAAALKANATKIILAHNHPSGNLKPSKADLRSTKHIISTANLLNIQVVDHLIITSEGYFSFREDGMI